MSTFLVNICFSFGDTHAEEVISLYWGGKRIKSAFNHLKWARDKIFLVSWLHLIIRIAYLISISSRSTLFFSASL